MLKVLQLIPTLDRSGAEKQMVLLATGLPRDRFEVEVAALTRLGPLETELKDAGIPVTKIGKRLKFDPMAVHRLTRWMKRKKFDVVQTWIFAANVHGRIAARRAGVPVIVTAEMAVDLWKSRMHLAIDRKLANWTDRVVGNSDAVVDFYRKASIPEAKLARIYSGIAREEAVGIHRDEARERLGLPKEVPIALFAGRLYPQKGVEDLIFAADLLQHVLPDLRTMIAGTGPLRERLEETAAAFELLDRGRVAFLGHREDVPLWMAASDVLVLPSRYEGLPNVVLEAMAMGKPVVATAAPGTTEVVTHDRTGLLVPIGDRPALAEAMRKVLTDPALAARLGGAGRNRVRDEFGIEGMIERFADLYESLARERGLKV